MGLRDGIYEIGQNVVDRMLTYSGIFTDGQRLRQHGRQSHVQQRLRRVSGALVSSLYLWSHPSALDLVSDEVGKALNGIKPALSIG